MVSYESEKPIPPWQIRLVRQIATSVYHPDWLKSFQPNEVIRPAWRTLQEIINEHLLDQVSLRVYWQLQKESSGNPLELSFSPNNLIGALWLQFAQTVTGGREYRQCQYCGKPFVLAPETARTNRRNCSNSCKALAWRKRTKEKPTKATKSPVVKIRGPLTGKEEKRGETER